MMDCSVAMSELPRLNGIPLRIIVPPQPSTDPDVHAVWTSIPKDIGMEKLPAGVFPGTKPPCAVRPAPIKCHESCGTNSPPVTWTADATVEKASTDIAITVPVDVR